MLDNLNIKYFPFFNSVKNPVSAAGTSDPVYNSGYDLLILEISGTVTAISLEVEGCINQLNGNGNQLDESDCDYSTLTVFKAEDYSMSTSVTDKGVYYVPINGRSRVRVKINSVTGDAIIVGALEK